jgi:hypothetical protein
MGKTRVPRVRRCRSLLLVFIVSAGCAAAAPAYRGFSYTPWSRDALLDPGSDRSILDMKADGANAVALNVWWFQDNERSIGITEDFTRYSASQDSVRHAIRLMHSAGLKVLLKPMVDCRNGKWRGEIRPSRAWFDAYGAFITLWAGIAKEEGVEAFSVGCELAKTEAWEKEWRQVVSAVRAVYPGPLTYAANHGSEGAISWWDAVNFIGIDAYYPLTAHRDPSQAELDRAWVSRAHGIKRWRDARWPGMTVVFTEVGYRSADGTNTAPWDYAPGRVLDLGEQRDCYQAFFSALWNETWWGGAFLWNWETNPESGGAQDTGYTPHLKPAEGVVRSYYLYGQ